MQTAGIAVINGIPFSVYGENLFILVQNSIIILMIWSYNKQIGFIEKLFVLSFFGGYTYALVTPGTFTDQQLKIILSSNTALGK